MNQGRNGSDDRSVGMLGSDDGSVGMSGSDDGLALGRTGVGLVWFGHSRTGGRIGGGGLLYKVIRPLMSSTFI